MLPEVELIAIRIGLDAADNDEGDYDFEEHVLGPRLSDQTRGRDTPSAYYLMLESYNRRMKELALAKEGDGQK